MKVLMLLENQWFKNPPRMQKMLATTYAGKRSEFIRTFLFFGCKSGKNIEKTFGDRWCAPDAAVWEETSPEMGSHPGEKFPPDIPHIAAAIVAHRPDVVVCFGKTACQAIQRASLLLVDTRPAGSEGIAFGIIEAPHPAARQDDVTTRLRAAAALLNERADKKAISGK